MESMENLEQWHYYQHRSKRVQSDRHKLMDMDHEAVNNAAAIDDAGAIGELDEYKRFSIAQRDHQAGKVGLMGQSEVTSKQC
jgi:hypothetical protein